MVVPNSTQAELFAAGSPLPDGFSYCDNFVSEGEEEELVTAIRRLSFDEVKLRGVVAKRRTPHFGLTYDFQTFRLSAAPAIPSFMETIRERAGRLAVVAATEFQETLVTEYSSEAGIGWHRDAPQFGLIVGISLLSECTMQFRPWPLADSSSHGNRKSPPVSQQ